MSVLIGQKLVENAKIEEFKCDIFGDFQTLSKGKNILGLLEEMHFNVIRLHDFH